MRKFYRIDADTIIFNTGALYQKHGQIIIAQRNTTRLHESFDCLDNSRDIPFYVNVDATEITDDRRLATVLNNVYVNNAYEALSLADVHHLEPLFMEHWKEVALET